MKRNLMKALSIAFTLMLLVNTVMAQAPTAAVPDGSNTKYYYVTGAFAVGIAAGLGAIGDSRAIAAACESTARNPGAGGRIFTMMILGLALIETLVLLVFVTVFAGK